MSEKLTAKEYAEKLLYTPEYAADKQADVKEKAAAFAEGYKKFMDSAKTEREAAVVSEQMLLAAGYKAFEPKKAYAPGEKVYFIQENKAVVAATIGQKPYEEGFRLVIAHIDCPRLDLRPNPLYESDHMSYFRTHYYGGIRKYQWATIPLAIHGVFTRADGSSVNFAVGEDENDPVFCITDLLPHLGAEQNERKLSEGIKGEELFSIKGTPPNLFTPIHGDAFAARNPQALKIDFVERPPYFEVSPTHKAKTWLLDPRAPKVEPPESIRKLNSEGATAHE